MSSTLNELVVQLNVSEIPPKVGERSLPRASVLSDSISMLCLPLFRPCSFYFPMAVLFVDGDYPFQ